jgi:DNA-binding NtrC family response regulator
LTHLNQMEVMMGQALPPLALVVEDDDNQRMLLTVLLEESDMRVVQCESAEAAIGVLEQCGEKVALLFTDDRLAGVMDGAGLAVAAKRRYPKMRVVVTSERDRPKQLPADAMFMPKPWHALDVLREAARSVPAR